MATNGHPVRFQDGFNGEGSLPTLPCDICRARCCLYFAMEIDKPTTMEDFENIKWYIIHRNTFAFVDDGRWFLQINQPCVHLGKHFECTIYDHRPKICRDHGYNEEGEPNCEYFHDDNEPLHDAEYHTLEEIDALMDKRWPHRKKKRKKS